MQFCNHCCSVAQFSFNMTVITGILIFIPAHCVFVCVWGVYIFHVVRPSCPLSEMLMVSAQKLQF